MIKSTLAYYLTISSKLWGMVFNEQINLIDSGDPLVNNFI